VSFGLIQKDPNDPFVYLEQMGWVFKPRRWDDGNCASAKAMRRRDTTDQHGEYHGDLVAYHAGTVASYGLQRLHPCAFHTCALRRRAFCMPCYVIGTMAYDHMNCQVFDFNRQGSFSRIGGGGLPKCDSADTLPRAHRFFGKILEKLIIFQVITVTPYHQEDLQKPDTSAQFHRITAPRPPTGNSVPDSTLTP
jgi:hypothetical protein